MAEASDCYSIKKKNVDFIVMFISSLVPQPLIAYVVMMMTGEGWSAFWYTILAINTLQFILWLVNAATTTIMFKLYFRERLVESVYDELVKMKFPTEGFYPDNSNSDVYYLDIACDTDIPCNIRIKAAAFCYEFDHLNGTVLAKLRMHKVHAQAIQKYFKNYPKVSVSTYFDTEVNYMTN